MANRYQAQSVSTSVSSRYQTVIPAAIREQFCIREGSRIAWVVRGDTIEVIPLPETPWQSFRGSGRDEDYLADLTAYRRQERAKAKTAEQTSESGEPK